MMTDDTQIHQSDHQLPSDTMTTEQHQAALPVAPDVQVDSPTMSFDDSDDSEE